MSNKNLNKNYTSKYCPNIVKQNDKINVFLSNEVLDKIKYLCKKIPDVEWSGILLYKATGNIKNPSKMKIHLKDIIPMNKGNKTYTEYNFNEQKRDMSGYEDRMIDYFNDNEKALEENWRVGHIHSHNTMDVFFSGTDNDELYENSQCHDFYLSLIVNNWMDITAKVALNAQVDDVREVTYYASDNNGNKFAVKKSTIPIVDSIIYEYDCNIINNTEIIKVDDYFRKNVDAIIEKADKKHSFVHKSVHKPIITKPAFGTKLINKSIKEDEKALAEFNDIPEDIEEFITTLFSGGSVVEDNIKSLLNQIAAFSDKKEFSSMKFAQDIMEIYIPVYEVCYEEQKENIHFFIETTEEVIEALEIFEADYPFLSALIKCLQKLVDDINTDK